MAISRMPVTLSDFNSPRYKSSVSKLKKLCPHSDTAPKLSAMRQAFARALGYGSENELIFFAEELGQYYSGSPLKISEVVTSVSQRIARQWNITIDSAESIALELGLQHFDACRPTAHSNNQKNEMINSPATNDSSSEEDPVVLPNSSLEEDKTAITIAQLDRLSHSSATFQAQLNRLTNGNPIQAELDRSGVLGLGAADLGFSLFKNLNESPAMKAIAEIHDSPAIRAMQEMNQTPAMKAIAEMHDSPAFRAMQEMNQAPAMKAIAEMHDSPAFRAIRKMNESPAMTILDRLNANPALVALDRLYAIPAVAERLSATEADMED